MGDGDVLIKGIGDGLLITLGAAGSWADAEAKLAQSIEAQQNFFRGAEVTLDVGERALKKDDIRKLRDKLAKHDVTLRAVLGESPDTIRSARRLDLETELESVPANDIQSDDGELAPIDSSERGSSGVLVKKSLRSGRIVRHVGHVVIIGDVNPGSQVIAGGDVLVWGRLRGTVHAGANGDESAFVCALDMRPMQLRIANHVAIAPDEGKRRPHPEVAFVKDGQIVAEEWGS